MSACIDVLHTLHQRIEALSVSRTLRKLREPFTESVVQGSALSARDEARQLDQIVIRAESYVLHTKLAYTRFV